VRFTISLCDMIFVSIASTACAMPWAARVGQIQKPIRFTTILTISKARSMPENRRHERRWLYHRRNSHPRENQSLIWASLTYYEANRAISQVARIDSLKQNLGDVEKEFELS